MLEAQAGHDPSLVPILPEHIWSKVDPKDATNGKYTNNPPYVGSGPFKAIQWKKNSHVYLVGNPDWWGPRPKIDEIYFMQYTNNDTLLQDLKAGTIDAGVDITATQMKQLQSEPGITARAVTVDGFDDLGFNCYQGPSKGHPVLRDWKFRQALNWAVDREKIVDLVWGGTTTAGTTIVPPDYYHDPDWHWEPPADVKYTFDPAIANQKLDEAGYPDSNGDGVRGVQGQAHRAGPDRTRGVGPEPDDREAHRRLVHGRGHQGQPRGDGRGHARRSGAELRGQDVHPRLRHVPLGLVSRLRPRLHAELPHKGSDRELERDLLVGPGV